MTETFKTETFKYDVFISHSSKDKPMVRELASRLKADGLSVWFDEWEISPGDIIGLKIEQGLEQSRTLVLVMSVNAFASEWVTLERHTALFRDPTNALRRFIPVRLDNIKIKDTLKQFAYVDWRQKSDEEYARLLAVCRQSRVGIKPAWEQMSEALSCDVLTGHNGSISGVAITEDGRMVVSGSHDGTVRVWDVEMGVCLSVFKGHLGAVLGVAISANGRVAVSGSSDTTVRVWEVKT